MIAEWAQEFSDLLFAEFKQKFDIFSEHWDWLLEKYIFIEVSGHNLEILYYRLQIFTLDFALSAKWYSWTSLSFLHWVRWLSADNSAFQGKKGGFWAKNVTGYLFIIHTFWAFLEHLNSEMEPTFIEIHYMCPWAVVFTQRKRQLSSYQG